MLRSLLIEDMSWDYNLNNLQAGLSKLETPGSFPRLTSLSLENNNLKAEGVLAVLDVLKKGHLKQLKVLRLARNTYSFIYGGWPKMWNALVDFISRDTNDAMQNLTELSVDFVVKNSPLTHDLGSLVNYGFLRYLSDYWDTKQAKKLNTLRIVVNGLSKQTILTRDVISKNHSAFYPTKDRYPQLEIPSFNEGMLDAMQAGAQARAD